MNFDWDERKRQINICKHGVDFADAVALFFDDLALSMDYLLLDDFCLVT